MSLYTILPVASIVIQALLIIHVIKTGRNFIWIWVIALLSFAGILAYVAVELIPSLLGSQTAQATRRGMKRALDPTAQLRQYELEARATSNVASNQRYADELLKHGRFDEAIRTYRSVLTGLYEHDPNLMLGLARAQFGAGQAAAARSTLEQLTQANPGFNHPDAQLLYARTLEAEGNTEQALAQYQPLATAYPGAEAAVRYAQLLHAKGRAQEAATVARELLERARIAPAHYRKAQRSWLDAAARIAR